MFVQNHMTTDPVTVEPIAPASEAWESMKLGRFHQLPVVDGNHRLLGIVTDRDIRSALGYDAKSHANLRVEEVMTHDPMCIAADATIEEAVALFCEHHCGAFPVMRSKVMVGILSRSDLLKAFRDFLGLEEPSRRIEIAIPHGASDLANTLSALKDEDEITSIIAARLRTDGAEPVLYIRTRTKNPWQLEKRLRAKGAILLARESLDSSE